MTKAGILIPARGGSTGVPRKNLREVGNMPLIEWVLDTALSTDYEIAVSTDCPDIKAKAEEVMWQNWAVQRRVTWPDYDPDTGLFYDEDGEEIEVEWEEYMARELNAYVVNRPKKYSSGPVMGAILYFIGQVDWDILILLQPTSPFTRVEDIHSVVKALEDDRFSSAQTISLVPHNHHWLNQRQLHSKGDLRFRKEFHAASGMKEKKEPVHSFGNVFAVRTEALLKEETLNTKMCQGIVIPRPYAFDCDTEEDFTLAEAMLEAGIVGLEV